jgi:hypothetical protein
VSVQACTHGWARRLHQTSSTKPSTHEGWARASRMNRSRHVCFGHRGDRGWSSSVWLASRWCRAASGHDAWVQRSTTAGSRRAPSRPGLPARASTARWACQTFAVTDGGCSDLQGSVIQRDLVMIVQYVLLYSVKTRSRWTSNALPPSSTLGL